ncbi:MAG: tryptophan synthase alpha chain [Verrucomicrobiales bacterium]|jgi:tryptophan synthase alpha chain
MPANRIDQTFADLKSNGKTAFVAYISAGDPDIDRSLDVAHALVRAGADIIELGVPFSDPLADGIVNQMAAQRALEAGCTTVGVLDLIRRFRQTDNNTPIVLFTYLNPIYTYGFEKFHTDASEAGADGILNLDLPPDEESENEELRDAVGLKHIRLIAPTTPDDRISIIAKQGEGFIYYVCQEGVTGARTELATSIDTQVAKIQRASETPVVVGFGISTPEQAATVAACADGVVVGSAIVKIVAANGDQADLADKVYEFVKPLVDATKSV